MRFLYRVASFSQCENTSVPRFLSFVLLSVSNMVICEIQNISLYTFASLLVQYPHCYLSRLVGTISSSFLKLRDYTTITFGIVSFMIFAKKRMEQQQQQAVVTLQASSVTTINLVG